MDQIMDLMDQTMKDHPQIMVLTMEDYFQIMDQSLEGQTLILQKKKMILKDASYQTL